MTRKNKNVITALAAALLLTAILCGCRGKNTAEDPAAEPAVQAEPAPTAEAMPETGRQDGERFEDVIILEGMEEAVAYEHVINDALGFEMDYDYELFQRQSAADRERFVSVYDLPGQNENYLDVTYSPRDAAAVAEAVSAVLSADYDIGRDDAFTLSRAGQCIRIDASNGRGNTCTPDRLQTVYIIPADDGCRVAAAHFSFESAEGFGRRFRYFMDTFSVTAARGEKKLSDEQALSAIRRYCHTVNPDLAGVEAAGEYPVYWDIASSDEQETVVVFRSYTGALIRYYIDRTTGETYVTEFVPGITAGEERTEERLNVWDLVF